MRDRFHDGMDIPLEARRACYTTPLLLLAALVIVGWSLWSWWEGTSSLYWVVLSGLPLGLAALRARRGPDVVLTDEMLWDRAWGLEPIALGDITFASPSVATGAPIEDRVIFGLLGNGPGNARRPTLRITVHPDAVMPMRHGWFERALTRLERQPADLPDHILEVAETTNVGLDVLGAQLKARMAKVQPRPAPPLALVDAQGQPEEVMGQIQKVQRRERWARVLATSGAIATTALSVWLIDALEPDIQGEMAFMIVVFIAATTWKVTYEVLAPKI